MNRKKIILVTGCAGFIGFHLSKSLIKNYDIVGVDNLNDYYDVKLKYARLKVLSESDNFKFHKLDICDLTQLKQLYQKYQFKTIVNFAAQAGVRFSITNPFEYISSNILGHLNILELARSIDDFDRLIYASSSSVYGHNIKIPFSVEDRTDNPASLYAATKKSDEIMTQSYCNLFGINAVGLRFFTVYGEYGRPDMAYFTFTKNILSDTPIDVYNTGKMKRDFTYIDDVLHGINGALYLQFKGHKIYNIGGNKPVELMHFISVIEQTLGKKAIINNMAMQLGDVKETYADIESSKRDLNFNPSTDIDVGLPKFIKWYRDYFGQC